jgi:hypothetical protein
VGLCCVFGLMLTSFSLGAKEVRVDPALSKIKNHWQEFRSINGECCMKFPKYPDHLSEKLRLPEIGFDLKYDAYISAIDQKTIFLLLIAQYYYLIKLHFYLILQLLICLLQLFCSI